MCYGSLLWVAGVYELYVYLGKVGHLVYICHMCQMGYICQWVIYVNGLYMSIGLYVLLGSCESIGLSHPSWLNRSSVIWTFTNAARRPRLLVGPMNNWVVTPGCDIPIHGVLVARRAW